MKKEILLAGILSLCFLMPVPLLAQKDVAADLTHKNVPKKALSAAQFSLKDALHDIETKFNVLISYKSELVENKKVSLNLSLYSTANDALQDALSPFDLTFEKIRDRFYVVTESKKDNKIYSRFADLNGAVLRHDVGGKVTDNEGRPLGGVSVQVAASAVGTSTDKNGEYALKNISESATLVFSFVGYVTHTISVGNKTRIDVQLVLNDTTNLNQVVVVGYGTTRKENLTGAVTQVSMKQLEQRPISNTIEGLRGLLPGLTISTQDARPDRSASISIRGVNSINGGEPLTLIDGVPGDLRLINPNDIESITVLKDAASSAVYGAQAAFGVFLVTTKSGKGAMRFHYSNNFSWIQPMHLPEVEPDILKYVNFQKQAGDDARRPYIDDLTIEYIKERLNNPSLPPIKEVEVNGEWRWLMADNENKFNKVWPAKLQGPSQKHDLSISGSEGKLSYYGAFGFLDQPGYLGLGDQSYQRYNVRFKSDYAVKDWLKISYNGYFSNENALYPSLAKGDADEPISGEIGLHGINTYETWKSPEGYFMYAPLAAWVEGGNEKRQISKSNHTIGFEMNFFQNALKFFGNYTYQPNFQKNENRRVIPLVQTEPQTDPVYYTSFENPNSFTVVNQTAITKPLNIWGQYEKKLGRDHYVKMMAGFNQESNYYYEATAMRMGMLSNTSRSLNLALGDSRVEDERSEWATRGTFYRINYHFKNKYLLETNGRYSLSSKFPSKDRGGFFPSFSAGWRVSEEPFFDKIKNVVDEFKIRGSWGQIGNQDVSNYLYSPTMAVTLTDTYVDGIRLYSVQNPDPISQSLTWETVSTLDFGFDAAMLGNRLSFTFDWYKKSITGMLTEGKTLPSVFGAEAPEANAADLKNTGWELGLQWQNTFSLKGSPFRYSAGLTLSDNIATITKFDNPSRSLDDYYIGQRIGELWGYEMLGLFNSDKEAQDWVDQSEINGLFIARDGKLHAGAPKVADLNGDGVVNAGDNTVDNPGDRKIIGNTSPRYIFGLTLSASYKGFDFYALFEGVGKSSFYPPYNSWLFWGTYNHEYVVPWTHLTNYYWTADNPNAYFPAPIAYGAKSGPMRYPNSRYLQNGAYMRLKNVSLGYSLPTGMLSKLRIYGLRFFVSGENMFDISKIKKLLKKPLDPEGVLDSHGNYDYPTSFRKISVGLDLTF